MDGWSSDEREEILIGDDRTMRVRRRLHRTGRFGFLTVMLIVVVLAAAGYGIYRWSQRPTGLAAIPNPAVIAPGGFRASIGSDKTITVGLEIRNTADVDVVVTAARVLPPAGLTSVELTLASPGEGNQGFALDGPLPKTGTVTLGTDGTKRNGVIAARFTVDCTQLPLNSGPTGEQIFVTVQLGSEQRVEELTPPVVTGIAWLTATARRACLNPVTTGSPVPPLPPLPTPTPGA